jgi:starch synthase
MKILFVASECAPFAKTGGLADVVGSLPREIAKTGEDVRVMLPLYRAISDDWRRQMEHVLYFYINLGWRRQYVGIERLQLDGVTYYFIDNEYYFGRSYIYGLGNDESERFCYFCRAVLESLPQLGFIPDVLHLNDWQTGLIPPMLEIQYRMLPLYKNIRTVYTVHNLQYQGIFPIREVEEMLSLGLEAYTADRLEFYGQCSCMKGGLTYAERITTVSPSYAQEIQTAYYGERLDGLLRARKDVLSGILNGIDEKAFDPANDPYIAKPYTADTISDKVENKLALQRELHLEENADVPLIGMVTRLSGQKGLDLVERVLSEIMDTGAQFVVLGMGEDKYVDLLNWAQFKYAGRLAACIEMNEALAHKIYAGADIFLMPSMFEPCGLSQMISLRYGTLPIVRETGGLRDTVFPYNRYTGEGNGFSFASFNAHDMLHVIEEATRCFSEDKATWRMLTERAMRGKYGWDQSALKYIALYRDLTNPTDAEPVIETEFVVEAPAPEAPKKPARKPRAKKATAETEAKGETKAASTTKAAAETKQAAGEAKPARKPRAKKSAE